MSFTKFHRCLPSLSRRLGFAMLCASLLVLLGVNGPANAQMSLREAVLRAVERDGEITALRQKVASRSIEIQAARDEYYPSISLSGDSATTSSNGPGVTLTVSQVLFDWGLIRSKIAAASQVRVQAVSDLKMSVESLTLLVAQYYLDIETIDLKIARTRRYMTFARRIAKQAEDRANAGISDRGEVARAQLEIARGEDRLAQLVANRQMALSQVEFLVGKSVARAKPPPQLRFARRYASATKIKSAVRIAPDYIAARSRMDEAVAGVETAKASRLPSIALQAQARADLNGGKTRSAVGITTGVDLSSSGLGRRQVQAATMNVRAAESSLLATRRTLTNKVNSALEQLQILRSSEASRVKQIAEARKVLENYEKQFVAGQRELIDLLTTGRDLYDSEIEALDTKDERKRTEYQAAHDLGVLGTLIVASSRG